MRAGLEVFEHFHVGVHLMVGMGETERDLVFLMDRLWRMGLVNHLFSFHAEHGSQLAHKPQPPWPVYLRIQLARYLIEGGWSCFDDMAFDHQGRITEFGMETNRLNEIISLGTPFMTTGCHGPNGQVACNRPFGNCLPDLKQWNYPYPPNDEEMDLIFQNIFKIE
jgi:biotin synthase